MKQVSKKQGSTKEFLPLARKKYIAFCKPYSVLTQFTREPGSSKRTLQEFGFPADVYPLGRLDYDSEGLLLLSDDGRLNQLLLNPKRKHWRSYLAQVEGIPDRHAVQRLNEGVLFDGRLSLPACARLLETEPDLFERPVPIRYRKSIPTAWLELKLCEGRNRQVRRMTAAVGHPTLRLVRIAIGALSLFDLGLEPGQWRELGPEDLKLCLS